MFDGRPAYRVFSIPSDGLEVGREARDVVLRDDIASRRHARISATANGLRVDDLNSSNGTFVSGSRSERWEGQRAVIHIGDAVFVADVDGERFFGASVNTSDGLIVGPTHANALAEIAGIADQRESLCIRGESGSGKEAAARWFHQHSARSKGPFVAINCAAIPQAIAERLLFGSVKGAFSGAEPAEGYLAAANGGSLFLDEVVELAPAVQAKLLRVLETRQVMQLGATVPREIALNIICAGHSDLREAVANGRFRDDLYYRIGRPVVELPALRERLEDMPHLIAKALREHDSSATADASLVEACMTRPWPGNIRELLGEVAEAGRRAGRAGRQRVVAGDLPEGAGLPLVAAADNVVASPGDAEELGRRGNQAQPDRQTVLAALRGSRGNVTAAARASGWHRNQLRRWIKEFGLDPKDYAS